MMVHNLFNVNLLIKHILKNIIELKIDFTYVWKKGLYVKISFKVSVSHNPMLSEARKKEF